MSDRANELLAASRRQSKDALCRASADYGGWCCQYHDGFGDGADIMGAERDEAIDRNGTLLGRLQDFLSLELQHHDRLVAGQTGGGDVSDDASAAFMRGTDRRAQDEADAERWRSELAETRHQVEFREDGWTVAHPLAERLNGSLFDCTVNFNHLDEPPALGRFWIEHDGSFTPLAAGQTEEAT